MQRCFLNKIFYFDFKELDKNVWLFILFQGGIWEKYKVFIWRVLIGRYFVDLLRVYKVQKEDGLILFFYIRGSLGILVEFLLGLVI